MVVNPSFYAARASAAMRRLQEIETVWSNAWGNDSSTEAQLHKLLNVRQLFSRFSSGFTVCLRARHANKKNQ
jgi:hypothetical protein